MTPNLRSVRLIGTPVPQSGEINKDLYEEAKNFLEYYRWVLSIKKCYLGAVFEGIIYIFLFEISSNRDDVEPWVWVIIGDLPPAYITCDDASNPYEALDSYIGAMQDWVVAAKNGKSVANLIPVNVPANYENGIALENRLNFLDKEILPILENKKFNIM